MKKRVFTLLLLATFALTVLTGCGDETTAKTDVARGGIAGDVDKTAAYLQKAVPDADAGALGGDWIVIGLARSDVATEQSYFDAYYKQLTDKVTAAGGILDDTKNTEYSRTILALTAIDKDPADVGGYNLLAPLADFEKTASQGLNGSIWALIALNAGNYEPPADTGVAVTATREMYLNEILGRQLADGGFALDPDGSEADIDITAMALQALAAYGDRDDVAAAIDKAVTCLSEKQEDNGGFVYWGAESCETDAQVITAMVALNISQVDERFIKNGNGVYDHMLTFRLDDGSFMHTTELGTADQMATEQAFYAMVSLERQEQGLSALYDMTDE